MTSAPTTIDLMCPRAPAATEPSTLSLHDALPIYRDALALAHEHGRRRRLEDRRALDLVARRERVHLVDGHLRPVAEPHAAPRRSRSRAPGGGGGLGRQHRQLADHRDRKSVV